MSCIPDPQNCEERPIGAPESESACSPCFKPDPKAIADRLEALERLTCALETKYNNWHQLLGRTRNRLTTLENEINNLPGPEEEDALVGCGGLETTQTADAIIVCEDGQEKAIVPSGTPMELQVCAGAVRVKERGLTYHPISPSVVFTGAVNSSNLAINLPSFPTDVCGGIVAKFECTGFSAPGPSGSLTNYRADMNGHVLFAVGSTDNLASSHPTVPVSSSANVFTIAKAGVGITSFTMSLVGYYY